MFREDPTLPVLYRAFPLSWFVTILLVCGGYAVMRCTEKIRAERG
ncbi:MAG: hypothetical protein V8T53_04110 [Eubacteriales bacterium]